MIVVGCGKRKLAVKAPARELYTGSLFRMARRYAEASGQTWGVLSAEYGLVWPKEELVPYEKPLALRGRDLEAWALRAAARCAGSLSKGEEVVLLMGHPYALPFGAALGLIGHASQEPLLGLGLGQRLKWLKEGVRG